MTERHLPDKAIDLLDEAAAAVRVALYQMPSHLKEMKHEIDHLAAEEEQAALSGDYQAAAQHKTERLQLEAEYEAFMRSGGRRAGSMRSSMRTTSPRWSPGGRVSGTADAPD